MTRPVKGGLLTTAFLPLKLQLASWTTDSYGIMEFYSHMLAGLQANLYFLWKLSNRRTKRRKCQEPINYCFIPLKTSCSSLNLQFYGEVAFAVLDVICYTSRKTLIYFDVVSLQSRLQQWQICCECRNQTVVIHAPMFYGYTVYK